MRVPSLFLSFPLFLLACASGSTSDTTEPGFSGGGGETGAGAAGADSGGKGGKSGTDGGSAGSGDAGQGSGGTAAGTGGNHPGDGGAGAGGSTAGAGGAKAGAGGAGAGGSAAGSGAGAGSGGSAAAGSGGSAAGSGGSAAGSGGAGAGGAGAGGAGAGGAGAGGAVVCEDKGVEPNNSEALAAPACTPAPCDITGSDGDGTIGYGGPHAALFGVVGPGDTDYFKFHGKDTTFTQTNPTAKTSDGNVKLCIFTACASETKNHECVTKNAFFEKSETGLQGCCIEGPGEVQSDHSCAGTISDDSADVFIRVTPTKNACASYSVDFHF